MSGSESYIKKGQYANDIFTTEREAISRSMDMGLEGSTHVQDYNGQAVFMPAKNHEEYIRYYEGEISEEVLEESTSIDRMEALRVVVQEIIKDKFGKEKGVLVSKQIENVEGQILKTDEEQRLVYGWASVVTEKGELVVDRQGDMIEPETLVKAVNNFMEHVRVGKEMHKGGQIGAVIHSMPITKEIGESLGIQSDREGWIVAFKVYDDDVWARVKSGELAAFSIGGRASKEDYSA